MRLFAHRDDHDWSQRHLSHYLEGDLAARARRRLERHASECPECSRAIRAMKALLRQLPGLGGELRPTTFGAFDRVRAAARASADEPGRSEERS
jgi:anti-sigma factor RsiW